MPDEFKLINATKETACRTAEAEAIRAKTGGTAPLTYDFNNDKGFADAIAAIPSGGTEITDGIVIKARDANGYATEIDLYMENVPVYQFYNRQSSIGGFIKLRKVNQKIPCKSVGGLAFISCVSLEAFDFSSVISVAGESFNSSGISELNAPLITDLSAQNYPFGSCPNLATVYLPKCTKFRTAVNSGTFLDCHALQNVQFGSVGYGVTQIGAPFRNCTQTGLTITVFCVGSYADTVVSNIRLNATNATIIIKASEDTTYGGETYLAGETILTSTPT